MLHTYVTCGEWKSCLENGWRFVVHKEKGGKLLLLEPTTTLDELTSMISEDYGIEKSSVKIECSFLPSDLINNLGSPPVIISNDRQVKNFVGYIKKKASIQLCVTLKPIFEFDLNEEAKSSECGDRIKVKKNEEVVPPYKLDNDVKGKTVAVEVDGNGFDNIEGLMYEKANEVYDEMVEKAVANLVKKSQRFESKQLLKAQMEIFAMKYNFDYMVTRSDNKWWSIRCKNLLCNWRLRAECLAGSTYFIINKYVCKHTCAPSSKTKSGKTASAKTIGRLIMQKYVGVKEGPKPKDVMQIMRSEQGVKVKYSLAYEAREYAISIVRGIPEKSYGKIPKYLYMLKAANPGTHYHYETDENGRFMYLFLSFGQSIRGFYRTMRKVIVVDGTFLKNKFRGVLLVATAQDGNSNLYPIAFGIVDSENNHSWEWFLTQLNIVIKDEPSLTFVSDRHCSIARGLEKVFPESRHGICIHHLINNVVSGHHGKGVASLVADAAKVYTLAEFKEKFTSLCNISRSIGKFLIEADIRKWARCLFPGFRYDIRTTNPAESINSALRSPREYPVIPLLDSIREMLTRWFHERRTLSLKHNHPLTIEIEKKVARRIEKGKKFTVYQINDVRFHVIGDKIDCLVDLAARTCSCGKYDLVKILCRHAIQAGLSVGREAHSLIDVKYTTATWRVAYEEYINPISFPEDSWRIPPNVQEAEVLPPETRQQSGRRKKKRYESAEDKIRSSKKSKGSKTHKCSRCHLEGHNKTTCRMPI